MRFTVENIKIKKAIEDVRYLSLFQKLVIKLFKIEIETKYNVELYLTPGKKDYFKVGMFILLSSAIDQSFLVISIDAKERIAVIIPTKSMTMDQIRLIKTSREGAYMNFTCPEGAIFKRIKY